MAEILERRWGVLLVSDGISHTVGIDCARGVLYDAMAAYPSDLRREGAAEALRAALRKERVPEARMRVVQLVLW